MEQLTLSSDNNCDRRTAVTGGLLGWGLAAGAVYVTVSLAQALTRPGFDLTRHSWSLLANGSLGWIQVTNLMVSGLMLIAFAVGVRRARPDAPRAAGLLGTFGLSLVAAGLLMFAIPAEHRPGGVDAVNAAAQRAADAQTAKKNPGGGPDSTGGKSTGDKNGGAPAPAASASAGAPGSTPAGDAEHGTTMRVSRPSSSEQCATPSP